MATKAIFIHHHHHDHEDALLHKSFKRMVSGIKDSQAVSLGLYEYI